MNHRAAIAALTTAVAVLLASTPAQALPTLPVRIGGTTTTPSSSTSSSPTGSTTSPAPGSGTSTTPPSSTSTTPGSSSGTSSGSTSGSTSAASSTSSTPKTTSQSPTVPPEATLPPTDPISVTLPKSALAALTTVPDYDIDPLLLAGLRTKLTLAKANEAAARTALAQRQAQLAEQQQQADTLEAEAQRARDAASTATSDYRQAVAAAYTSQSTVPLAVEALLAPQAQSPADVVYSATVADLYVENTGTHLSDAGVQLQSATQRAAEQIAKAARAEQDVQAAQRSDEQAVAKTSAITKELQDRIAQIRRDLAAKQAAQQVTVAGATARWKAYLQELGTLGVKAPDAAALSDPAHLPHGLQPLLDTSGAAQPGVAVKATAHGKVLVVSQQVIEAVGFALAQLGKPYVFGATGPNTYDCSGLTMTSYANGKITTPRTAAEQFAWAHPVAPGKEMPGDLVFFVGDDGSMTAPGHVAMVLDPTRHLMIQAPQTGDVVKISDYSQWGGLVGFGRPSISG